MAKVKGLLVRHWQVDIILDVVILIDQLGVPGGGHTTEPLSEPSNSSLLLTDLALQHYRRARFCEETQPRFFASEHIRFFYVLEVTAMAKRQSKKQASQVEVNPPQESLANNMDHPPGALGLRTHHGWTPGKGNILEAKTLNATPFRTLFEALKAMITEANLVFSENGLRMAAIDTKQNAFVHLSIPSSSFELYHCEERLVLGVDIPVVQKIIKTAKLGDTLSFIVHEDSRDKLRICIENAERLSKGVYPIPLRSLAEYKVRDALTFREAPPEIASAEFLGYCRNMVTLGSTRVEIQ